MAPSSSTGGSPLAAVRSFPMPGRDSFSIASPAVAAPSAAATVNGNGAVKSPAVLKTKRQASLGGRDGGGLLASSSSAQKVRNTSLSSDTRHLESTAMQKDTSDEGSNPLKRRNTDAGADYPRRRATIAVSLLDPHPSDDICLI